MKRKESKMDIKSLFKCGTLEIAAITFYDVEVDNNAQNPS